MSSFRRTAALVATAGVGLAITFAGSPAQADVDAQRAQRTVDVRLIGINDLHGNIEPPTGSSGRVTLADGTTVNAGGAAYLATHVKKLQARGQELVVRRPGRH